MPQTCQTCSYLLLTAVVLNVATVAVMQNMPASACDFFSAICRECQDRRTGCGMFERV